MKITKSISKTNEDRFNTLVYPLDQINIDPDRLLADVRQMDEELWTLQNRYKNVERWKGIALYSVGGDPTDIRVADRLPVYKTAAGERCPYICNELLPQLGAPWLRVILYRLEANTQIGEHRDLGHNRNRRGPVRIHIPVITNDKVLMYVDRKQYHFSVGQAWYFDATARHKVENNSDQDRIHLVIDLKSCRSTDDLLKPITMKDHIRFAFLDLLYCGALARHFFRFIWTAEGRARIRARLAIVLRKDRS